MQIAYGFLSKSIQTLRGICILLNEGLNEEAQALVRILFETRMGFDHFKHLCQANAQEATLLFLDAIVIEKEKQYRAAGYAGPAIIDGIEVRPGIEADLEEVSKRRTEDEIKQIRRFGFTKMSVEALAKATGHDTTYQILYRNFSRNVHGRDFTETLLREDLVQPSPLIADYLHIREQVTINEAFKASYGLLDYLNHNFDMGHTESLERVHDEWTSNRNPHSDEEPS